MVLRRHGSRSLRFGGGCSASFVSPQGLILTNHHCGYSAIQQHSSLEHDYLNDGFFAPTLADELRNDGLTVTFTGWRVGQPDSALHAE